MLVNLNTMLNYFIYIFCLFSVLFAQEQIGQGLFHEDLINYLQNNYKTSTTESYNNARDILYGNIDKNNGSVYCIYTDYSVVLPNNVDPSTHLYENGMNCEHLWPQSMYEASGANHMKSDMHHLRPCKENVNSYRSNKPYGESVDMQTNNWLWLTYNSSSIPQSNISEYSENGSSIFEPRENVKGDIARAMFYFYTMYSNVADDEFFENQKEILYTWHQNDPIEQSEINRTWEIAEYQDYPNPFILDDTLIQRCYFDVDYMMGDVNQDFIINILDIIVIMNYILNLNDLNEQQLELADMNQDNGINILDIILLIGEIIS